MGHVCRNFLTIKETYQERIYNLCDAVIHTSSRCLCTRVLTYLSRSSILESVDPSSIALRDSARFNGKKSNFS